MKDFVFTSPFRKVEPIVLFGAKSKWTFNEFYIKLNPANTVQENLTMLSDITKKYNPDYPFEYHFADVEYANKFANLKTTLTTTTVFASVAIFIACLGLLSLSTFMIESRIKEIGIRKVFGATVMNITRLLCWNSVKPIFIAIVLFSPLAWLSMTWWLESFDYRIELHAGIILASSVAIILLALTTIVSQTIGAANRNPVNSLRSE